MSPDTGKRGLSVGNCQFLPVPFQLNEIFFEPLLKTLYILTKQLYKNLDMNLALDLSPYEQARGDSGMKISLGQR